MKNFIIENGKFSITRIDTDKPSAEAWALATFGVGYTTTYVSEAMSVLDIKTIEDLFRYGEIYDKDFKAARDDIKSYAISLADALIISTEVDPDALSPNVNDYFIIGNGAVNAWAGKDGQIAQWDGADWVYFAGDGYAGSLEELGFTQLLPDTKMIAATCLIGTVAQQLAEFPNQKTKTREQGLYKEYVQKCRNERYKFVENYTVQMIPQYAGDILKVILNNFLHFMYRDQGVDGLNFGDTDPGLADYVYGTGPFDGIGLKDQSWLTLYGDDMITFTDYIGDKLFYGGLKLEDTL